MSERLRRKEADEARRRIAHYNAIRKSGGTPDLDDLRAMAYGEDPDIAARASASLVQTLVSLGSEDLFLAELPRLSRLGRSEVLPPSLTANLLAIVVWKQCTDMFTDFLRTHRQPDPGLLSETAELAELAYARAPDKYHVRLALAWVRCAQDRDREASDLLIVIPLDRLEPGFRADVLAIRALAEAPRDLAQARRLIALGRRYGDSTPLLTLLDQMVTAAERHSAASAPEQET